MSDFGADTCDFHSDFASDFRTESDDYASDFRDFPGDFSGDFGGAPRPHQKPRPAWRDHADSPNQSAPAPQGPATPPRARGGARWRQAGSTPQSGNARRGGDATPQGHKQGAQRTRGGTNVGTAARVKAPYRGVKMANKAYNKKSPEYTGSKGKPRTACAMRGGGHFWSLARSKSSRMGCNRIYSKIKSGTPLPRPPDMRRSRARSARPPSGCWRSCPRSAAGSCIVPQYRPS